MIIAKIKGLPEKHHLNKFDFQFIEMTEDGNFICEVISHQKFEIKSSEKYERSLIQNLSIRGFLFNTNNEFAEYIGKLKLYSMKYEANELVGTRYIFNDVELL